MDPRDEERQDLGRTEESPGGAGSLGTVGGRDMDAPSPAAEPGLAAASGRMRGCVIYLNSDAIGGGAREHGRSLMRAFLYTLTEIAPQPEAIIMAGDAVRLAQPGSDAFECLSLMQEQGVQILLAEPSVREAPDGVNAAVGRTVTMHIILDRLLRAEKVITL
jgi:hypothetical protein